MRPWDKNKKETLAAQLDRHQSKGKKENQSTSYTYFTWLKRI